jgi:hypothetical protein
LVCRSLKAVWKSPLVRLLVLVSVPLLTWPLAVCWLVLLLLLLLHALALKLLAKLSSRVLVLSWLVLLPVLLPLKLLDRDLM